MAYYFYGLRAVLVALTAVSSSYLAEYLSVAAMRKKFDWSDVSPMMNGLLIALLLPASVPYTITAFAAAFAAIVCKHAFGGNSNLIFCPVCVSYIFTSLCFPSYILRYPVPAPFGSVPTANQVTSGLTYSYTRALDTGSASTFSLLDIIWGKLAGPMGTSAILIILIAAVALYFFRDIPSTAFFAGIGANILINVIFPVGETGWYAVLNSLVAGSFLFVYVFMACDLRYVPKRAFSQLVWGVGFAAAAYLIRLYTSIENSAVFALPMFCIFRDELDRLSDALEKLLRFIGKWIAIGAKFVWKWIKIGSVKLAGAIASGFDAFCEFLSQKFIELSDKHKAAKAEKENAQNESGTDGSSAEEKEDTEITEENSTKTDAESDASDNSKDGETAEGDGK